MARYAPTHPPTTADIHQLERWLREEHELVRQSTDDIYVLAAAVLANYSVAAYLSIGMANPTALANIDAAWQTLNIWDTTNFTNGKGAVPVFPGGLRFTSSAIWQLNLNISLAFTEAQGSRDLQMRLFDATDGVAASQVFNFAVGRNTEGANLILPAIATVQLSPDPAIMQVAVAKALEVQIHSEADTFTGVSVLTAFWDVHSVGELQQDVGIEASARVAR